MKFTKAKIPVRLTDLTVEWKDGYKFKLPEIECTEFGVFKDENSGLWRVSEMSTGTKAARWLHNTRHEAVQDVKERIEHTGGEPAVREAISKKILKSTVK